MRALSFTALAGLISLCVPVTAQVSTTPASLPAEIDAAVRSAPFTRDLIPISGQEAFPQQIIKADEISFAEGAKLTLTNLDAPYIVIAARKLKFARPEAYSFIQRDLSVESAAKGKTGDNGRKGADQSGETNRRGNDGSAGGPGDPGLTGGSRALPKVYIVVDDIEDPKGKMPPGVLNLVIVLRGIDGGEGGQGGRGGDGGRAGNGKKGATSAITCMDGGGPGGTGGAAGQGGKGGNGGGGGDGADLVLVTNQTTYDVLSYARINNAGGLPGHAGRPGDVGTPGSAGSGAGRNGYCGSTGSGSPGLRPSPPDLGKGSPGPEGHKGTVTAAILPSLADFFAH